MIADQQKSQIIIKREPISLEFKGILCFQNSSRAFSPILQIFNNSGSISISQGNQRKNSIRNTY